MEQTEFIGNIIVALALIVPLLIVLINVTTRLTKAMTILEATIKHFGEHLLKDEELLVIHSEKLHEHDLKILSLQRDRD